MQIPALWTDLDKEQTTLGKGYLHAVLWLAQASLPNYRIMICNNSYSACGWCNCPIGQNHNYLGDSTGAGEPMCFDCAEEEFYLPQCKNLWPDETSVIKPSFLNRYREVKFR